MGQLLCAVKFTRCVAEGIDTGRRRSLPTAVTKLLVLFMALPTQGVSDQEGTKGAFGKQEMHILRGRVKRKMLGPILPVQLLQQSKICPSSVLHIRRTRQTSTPTPTVTFMSLDRSKRRWEATLLGPTRGAAGGARAAALSAKRIFS